MSTPESNPRVARILRTRLGSTLAALGADAWRTIVAALVAVIIAANALAASAAARPTAPACPATVIPDVPIIPNAVGCWNAIAVQTVRLAAPYNVQDLIYMGYTQAAVYDAVTKIDRRYEPYHDFAPPAGVDVATASPDAAATAAAYTRQIDLGRAAAGDGPDVVESGNAVNGLFNRTRYCNLHLIDRGDAVVDANQDAGKVGSGEHRYGNRERQVDPDSA